MQLINKQRKLEKQIKEYLEYCEYTRGFSKYTIASKRSVLNQFKKCVPITCLEEVTNKQIDEWIKIMSQGSKRLNVKPCIASTINHNLAHTIAMFKYFRDMNLEMPNLKLALIRKQKIRASDGRKFYYRHEIMEALAQADRREWLWIALSFDCGLRISELQNMRISHLDGREIRIIGKGGKLRHCMMAEETYKRLQDYIQREKLEDHLWSGWSPTGEEVAISVGQIERRLKDTFTKAGFPEFHHHMLRHSFAMDLLLVQKAPLRVIQTLLGHARMETTERYLASMSASEVKEAWLDVRYKVTYSTEIR